MTRNPTAFARRALWALPGWAALLGVSTLTRQPDPRTAFAEFAAYVTTDWFLLSHLAASIGGAAIGSIGVIGAMLYLQDSRAAGTARLGMTATVAANTLVSSVFGAAAFAQPAIGRAFLAGEQGAVAFYEQVYSAPLFATVFFGLLLFMGGGVLTGIAIASSGRFPRWTGWVYAAATVAFVFSNLFFPEGQTVILALLFVATVAIAWTPGRTGQRPSSHPGLPSPSPEPVSARPD